MVTVSADVADKFHFIVLTLWNSILYVLQYDMVESCFDNEQAGCIHCELWRPMFLHQYRTDLIILFPHALMKLFWVSGNYLPDGLQELVRKTEKQLCCQEQSRTAIVCWGYCWQWTEWNATAVLQSRRRISLDVHLTNRCPFKVY